MNFNIKTTILLILFWVRLIQSVPADEKHPDFPWRDIHHACEPSHFGLSEFNGFRILHQAAVSFPVIHHTVLTHCALSKVDSIDAYFPVNRSTEMPWGVRFCSSEHSAAGNCYIMARRKDATFRNVAMYYPGDWVGGIFRCPGTLDDNDVECTNENAFPIYPIMADMSIYFWDTLPDLRHYDFRFPMLKAYTIGAPLRFGVRKYVHYNWYREIDIHENYDFTTDERNMIRMTQDYVTNLFGRIVSTRVGALLSLTWDNEVKDFGDGVARRDIYKAFPRRHFQPEHWFTEPHYSPTRSYKAEAPVQKLMKDGDGQDAVAAMKGINSEKATSNRFKKLLQNPHYNNLTAEIKALATGKAKIYAVDFLKYLPFIPENDLTMIRNQAYKMYDIAIKPNTETYDHPNPPENIYEFLKKPYFTESDAKALME